MEQFVHSAWSMIPFGIMLLMIAIGPLVAEKFWEKNVNKLLVSLILGVPTAVCLIIGGMAHELEHQVMFDYIPFIVLLLALFVITGGIHISGDIKAKPIVNTGLLALGWVLAPTAAMSCKKPASRSSAKRWGRFFTCWNRASFCRSPSSPGLTVSSWELLYPLPSVRQTAAEVV